MDDLRFDDVARRLADARPRRHVLATLTVGFFGLLAPAAEAERRKQRGKDRCRGNEERCNGRCVRPCLPGQERDPRGCGCRCPEGTSACGRGCVPDGECCPGEKACCGGCVAEESCCPCSHHECQDGSCLPKDSGRCCPGFEACAAAPNGCCNALAGEECATTGCCDTLLGSNAVCGGECVETATDRRHCGGCDRPCAANERCEGGACRTECPTGSQQCGGACVDTRSDERHCGGCGVACPYPQECHGGQCWHFCNYNGPNRACCPLDQRACWYGHACMCCDQNCENCAWPPNCPTSLTTPFDGADRSGRKRDDPARPRQPGR